jgi:hypothetical protein
MLFEFISGTHFQNLSKKSKDFIQYATGDPSTLLDVFNGEVFKNVEFSDDEFGAALSTTHTFDEYVGTELYVELVAVFYQDDEICFTSRESLRSFDLDKYDSQVFEKQFAVFFDKSGHAFPYAGRLHSSELYELNELCSEVKNIYTNAYKLDLYIIADPEGVMVI